ncbi:MAG: VWA domain-containing protein [Pyrinomonadaceae bacterium]
MERNVATLIFVLFSLVGSAFAQNDDDIKVQTDEIKLNVSAFNQKGGFVPNVGVNDLVIIEDGRLNQPTSVRRIPANVLIVMDTGGEMRLAKDISLTRQTAKNIIASLAPEDSIALMDYNDKPNVISEWTTDRNILTEALDTRLSFGIKDSFVDALKLATDMLRKSESDNRHLILISEGTDSIASNEQRNAAMRDLMTTNINVHVLSYAGMEGKLAENRTKRLNKPNLRSAPPAEVNSTLPPGIQEVNRAAGTGLAINLDRKMAKVAKERVAAVESGKKFLKEISSNTSGLLIVPEDKEEMLSKGKLISSVIDSNYVVTYIPRRPLEESKPGEERIIEVAAKKPGLRASAKRIFVVGNN